MEKRKKREIKKNIQLEKKKRDIAKSVQRMQISECEMDQSKTLRMITDKKKNVKRKSDVLRNGDDIGKTKERIAILIKKTKIESILYE